MNNLLRIPLSSYDVDDPSSYLTAVSDLRKQLMNEKFLLEEKLGEFKENLNAERLHIVDVLRKFDDSMNTATKTEDDALLTKNKENNEIEILLRNSREISSSMSYLMCLKQIENINVELEENVKQSNWPSVCIFYEELKTYNHKLKSSSCIRLKEFVKTTKKCWKQFLTRVLNDVTANMLETFGFPHQESIKNAEEFKKSLTELAKFSFCINSNFDNFTESLLSPLRTRFIYHFSDPNSKTGVVDMKNSKPEWYLSLILKWHKKYTPLVSNFDDLPDEKRQIPIDFCRGLVILGRERFKFDLNFVADNVKILPHLIDEAIAFDLELRASNYPDSDVGCVELLTEPVIFESWLQLENQQCTKCVETLLADASAWRLRYLEASDLDRFKVPRCADSFLSLLSAMTQRYRLILSRQHRLQFVHLQRTLIDDFRMHLFLLTRSSPTPWATPFTQIVNAAAYVKLVLSQWQELPFFVDLETGIFDELVDLFEHLRRQMLNDAKEAALEEIKFLLNVYRKDVVSRNFGENSLATIVVPIQTRLLEVQELLSASNFRDWVRSFAESLEKLLVESVIFEIRVDSKIGEELQTQLAISLPKMFHSFGLSNSAYFQKLNQCLIVYSLNVAGCVLLREGLRNKNENIIENILLEMGLSLLRPAEIEGLLQRRSDVIMT